MKKIFIKTFLIALIFLLSSCNSLQGNNSKLDSDNNTHAVNNNNLGEECIYTDENNDQVKVYILGEYLKTMDIEESDQGLFILAKGQTMWMWDEVRGIGSQTDFSQLDEDSGLSMRDKPIRSAKDMITIINDYKKDCKTKNFSNSEFEPPSNINFVLQE